MSDCGSDQIKRSIVGDVANTACSLGGDPFQMLIA